MQIHVKIRDSIWKEFVELEDQKERIHEIAESALISHINKLKAYKNLLRLEGKAPWVGNLDKMRENRI